MKRMLASLVLVLVAPAGWADFSDGVVAHLKGDFNKALQIMVPLAETSHHPYAQYYLGIMYANGQGVNRDLEQAAKWYEQAAKQGVPQAQYRLGRLYASGQGVPQDFERAYAWLSVASHLGHKAALSTLNTYVPKLSPEELIAAQNLAAEFVQNYGKKPDIGSLPP